MAQEEIWDREYRKSKLLTKENKPQSDVVRFVKYLKKEKFLVEGSNVLDLGSGVGRNSFYFAELGASATGLEISKTAIDIAEENAQDAGLSIKYIKQSIGEKFPIDDNSIDIVLDVTSSNSLTEDEREEYLSESHRVLKNDGDANAKFLIKNYPGKEKDTYTMPELRVTERVWTREDFVKTYENYFKIVNIEKKTSYPRMNNRVYKRNYFIAYLRKN
jgi:ubiquinone/menaquinone biosynthesis C-methylase UbiE